MDWNSSFTVQEVHISTLYLEALSSASFRVTQDLCWSLLSVCTAMYLQAVFRPAGKIQEPLKACIADAVSRSHCLTSLWSYPSQGGDLWLSARFFLVVWHWILCCFGQCPCVWVVLCLFVCLVDLLLFFWCLVRTTLELSGRYNSWPALPSRTATCWRQGEGTDGSSRLKQQRHVQVDREKPMKSQPYNKL